MLAKRTDAVYTMTEIAASDSIKEQLWPKQGWTNKQTVEKEKKKKHTVQCFRLCGKFWSQQRVAMISGRNVVHSIMTRGKSLTVLCPSLKSTMQRVNSSLSGTLSTPAKIPSHCSWWSKRGPWVLKRPPSLSNDIRHRVTFKLFRHLLPQWTTLVWLQFF